MLQWTVWENLEEELDTAGLHRVHISKITSKATQGRQGVNFFLFVLFPRNDHIYKF